MNAMKKYAPVLAVLLAALLAGCATPPRQAPTEIDSHYVGMVEHQARQIGTEVYWVNPPRREREPREDS